MPRRGRSKSRKGSRKRRRTGRSGSRFGNIVVNPTRSLLPNKYPVRLTYSQEQQFTLDMGGIVTVRYFRSNGMYDPDKTGLGHQPRGFDNFMALYKNWVVVGSKITVNATHVDSTQAIMSVAVLEDGLTPTWSAGAAANMPETRGTAYRVLQPSGQASAHQIMRKGFSLRKDAMGKAHETEYFGDSGADPNKKYNFCIGTGQVDSALVAGSNIKTLVKIEYSAIFLNPVQLNLS